MVRCVIDLGISISLRSVPLIKWSIWLQVSPLTSFSVSPPVWMDGFCSAMAGAVHVFVFRTVWSSQHLARWSGVITVTHLLMSVIRVTLGWVLKSLSKHDMPTLNSAAQLLSHTCNVHQSWFKAGLQVVISYLTSSFVNGLRWYTSYWPASNHLTCSKTQQYLIARLRLS